MFEREEEKLAEAREKLDGIPVPELRLDAAIQAGIRKAKQRKRLNWKPWAAALGAAAAAMLLMLGALRTSPALSKYAAGIPGMERIVELVSESKGLTDAVEHDHFQHIGLTEEKNGYRLTVDSVIADEQQMIIFYTLSGPKQEKQLELVPEIKGKHGRSPESVVMSSSPLLESGVYEGEVEFQFTEPQQESELDFQIDLKTAGGETLHFDFPLKVDPELYKKQKKSFSVNQTAVVEGQKIKIRNVTIYPLRTKVEIEFAPDNTKEIFGFEDLKITDSKGEVWSGVINGVNASGEENEMTVFLESNYFKEPDNLYLTFSKIRAIDKDRLLIKLDPETGAVLEGPPDGRMYGFKVTPKKVSYKVKMDPAHSYEVTHGVMNENGEDIYSGRTEMHQMANEGVTEFFISYDRSKLASGPIVLKISDYPSVIRKEVKIELE